MQYVTSIFISSSTFADSNDENDVDMNASAIPNIVKPNVEKMNWLTYQKDYVKEEVEEKKQRRKIGTGKSGKRKISLKKFMGSIWSTKAPDTTIFPFSEVVRLKGIQIPVAAEPIFFCKHFVTDKLSDQIIFEINNYTQKIINSKRPLRRHSIINKWHPVDAIEP